MGLLDMKHETKNSTRYQLSEGTYGRPAKSLNLGVLRVETECVLREFTMFSSPCRISGQVYSVFRTCGLHERGGGHRSESKRCLEPLTRVHEETETLIGRIAVSDDRSSTRPSRRETGHIKAILFVNSCPSCCRRV